MAVSVDLLSFYRALFERSCDAINALASALKNHYSRWGFQMTDAQVSFNYIFKLLLTLLKGGLIQDPFRRGLGYAVQWFDILQVQVEQQLETLLQRSWDRITAMQASPEISETHSPTLHPGQCAPLLVQRCPACFGGTLYGRSTAGGGDIHVATDGNFHHRH